MSAYFIRINNACSDLFRCTKAGPLISLSKYVATAFSITCQCLRKYCCSASGFVGVGDRLSILVGLGFYISIGGKLNNMDIPLC